MNRYEITVKYWFEGRYFVGADSLSEAKQKVSESCGMTLGRAIHSSLPENEIDWEFPVHPEMNIRSIKNNRGEKNHGNFS